jgi:MoaA/NifB/PqqE/SkfB family radical SAM enzyme
MDRNRWTVLDYLRVGFGRFPKGFLVGIDVTFRCNLNCVHCYFKHQGYHSELSTNEWVSRLQALKDRGLPLYTCGWLGGEPLLRPDVIDAGRKFFKSNVIFTNGTHELPDWPDSTFVVSIPGDKTAYCDLTGGNEAVYATVKEHASRPDLDVIVAYCITRRNAASIANFLKEWRETGVKGVFFEFYTPSKGEDNRLWLDWQERDRVVDELLQLKKPWGDFIYNKSLELRLMKTAPLQRILACCHAREAQLSLDPMGNPKSPCQLGPEADCSRCGCILPIWSFLLWRKRFLLLAFAEGVWRQIRGL